MYSSAFAIDNKIDIPVMFYATDDAITARSFWAADASPVVALADPAEMLNSHAPRYGGAGLSAASPPELWYDGSAIGLPGKMVALCDQILIENDPLIIGASAKSDRCDIMVGINASRQFQLPYNRTAYTQHERLHKDVVYRSIGVPTVLTITIPLAGDSFSQSRVYFKWDHSIQENAVLFGDGAAGSRLESYQAGSAFHTYGKGLPTVKLLCDSQSVAANGIAHCEVMVVDGEIGNVIDCASTVYLEAVSGYLPHTRVQMVGGRGKFRAIPLGLLPGEKMRIKGGFRYVPGLADLEMEVVSA